MSARLKIRRLLFLLLLGFLALAAARPAPASPASPVLADPPEVRVITIDGVIDPIVAAYLMSEIEAAQSAGAAAMMVRMDTPGGLDISMRSIIQKILSSKIPVIVYVAPSGARAASAGAFITLSAHVAAMAPGTTIGAAHPVNLGGRVDAETARKIENDAAAFIRSLAREKGRNPRWAEDAVRKSVSATAGEAARLGVVDFIARSNSQVLEKADGRRVKVGDRVKTLRLAGARLVARPMGFRQRLLHALIDPNIVFILMTLGIYGIIYELANPGFGFAGIGGAIALILALYGLQALPINLAGLALLVLAFVLFIAEAFTPTFGVLAGGGLIAFIFGALILIDAPRPQLAVSAWVILPVALATLAFVVFVLRAAWRTHRKPVVTGTAGMIGLRGKAAGRLAPDGQVAVHGEVWSAEAVDPPIRAGEPVEVVGIEGLKLRVRKVSEKKED